LFGIPFVLGTLLFGSIALMTVAGKVEVRLSGDRGEIVTGVGPVGRKRHFALTDVEHVREDVSRVEGAGASGHCIVLEGQRRIRFGSGLSAGRRQYVRRALQAALSRARRNSRV
jgi:hypothetical protein